MRPTRLHRFRPRLLDALPGYGRPQLLADVGAGITVGVVALPLAMAFAIASGVKPEQGPVHRHHRRLLISALGGSHVQIGGPAGAFIVIVYGIVERYGLTNLLISTAMAGVLLFLMGWFKLGALVRYVPVAIVIGFTNGIAVLIGLSQVKDFFGLTTPKLPGDFFALIQVLAQHAHTVNPWAVAIGPGQPGGGGAVAQELRHAARARWAGGHVKRAAAHLPGTIVALAGRHHRRALLQLPVETIGTRFGGIPQSLPSLRCPSSAGPRPSSW
jgi:SulP family sulfate permease